MPTVANLRGWNKAIDEAKKKVHTSANQFVRNRVRVVLDKAVQISPQWSGNYAVNWTIETNQLGQATYDKLNKVTPWQSLQWWDTGTTKLTKEQKKFADKRSGKYASYAGAPEALRQSKVRNYELIDTIKWNTKVKLVNRSPVADLLNSGDVKLRRVNMIDGHVGVMSFIKAKYSYLV